jgi:probable dihydroxyacetone kinase regulator
MKKDYYTKKRIAETFKELNKTIRLQDITVSDIANAADINRSTFYYHFIDKYDLMNWIFKEDITSQFIDAKPGKWMHNTLHLLKTFKQHKEFYKQIIEIDNYLNLRKYIYDATRQATITYIDNYLKDNYINPKDKEFIVSFITSGFVETNINYLINDCNEEPEVVLQRYVNIIEPSLCIAIDNFLKKDH